MELDALESGVIARHMDLQQRLWEARHGSMRANGKKVTARQLFKEIKKYLIKAADARLLQGGAAKVHDQLKYDKRRDGTVAIAVGDRRNFRRDPALPHFRRTRDDAWFDFQLHLAERARGIDVLAYDFELRLTQDDKVTFVRFDLNPEGHGNDDIGLRSHMHLSSDDDGMSVPAPVMSPIELLDVMVHGLVQKGRIRRSDSPA